MQRVDEAIVIIVSDMKEDISAWKKELKISINYKTSHLY